MAYKKFRISTRNSGRLRTIKVWIYDTVEELRVAGERHSRRMGEDLTGFDKAFGLSQAFEGIKVYESGTVRRDARAGHIRLCRIGLLTGVISHEATHMAVSLYRQDIGKRLPETGTENNEALCYLVGDITSKIVRNLYKLEYL